MSDISTKVDLSGTHTSAIILVKGGYGYAETSQISVPKMADYTVNINSAQVYTDNGTASLMSLPEFNPILYTDGFNIGVHNQAYVGYAGRVQYTLTKKS